MSAFFVALRLFAGNALGALWKWLSGLNLCQLVCLGLAVFCIAQHFMLVGERRHSAKVEQQLAKANEQLQRISTKRNEQHDVTEHNVEKVVRGDPLVKTVVKTIHDAPNPEGCRTPALDQLRDVL